MAEKSPQELIQIDTTDILFICTGAFNGIEDIVRRRTGERGLGFGDSTPHGQTDFRPGGTHGDNGLQQVPERIALHGFKIEVESRLGV